ncbi:DsbA family oxidoreductase [Solibacillus sp. FSL R7-0682]|uniref:DsbA family oxidoreductase n=1 Tax=Solibacillus sp. FSL R7-0682 TaxID=2921690 RepID=UPI0030F8B41C
MKIEIFSDFACPFCYIGKKRLELAIKELGMEQDVEIEYKAYELDADTSKEIAVPLIQEGVGSSDMFQAILDHAKEVGLTYNLDKVLVGNTENAHRLAKWAKKYKRDGEFIEEVMHRYFQQGLNVNDSEQLLSVVNHVGLPVAEAKQVLSSPEAYQEELARDRYDIQQIPVTSVPFFVFENRYGIKGAEPLHVFKETLQQAASYIEKQPKLQMQGETGASCDINGCD